MKILVTYIDDDMLIDVPTIEINGSSSNIVVAGYDLTPRLRSMAIDLAVCLVDFHEALEASKC